MLLWPVRWMLRKVLGILAGMFILGIVLLWGLQWVPLVPVGVVQDFLGGRAPKWSWQSDFPSALCAALRQVEEATRRKTVPPLAQRTAELVFYPEQGPKWGSSVVGMLLELLWSEERLLTLYLNSIPYDSDVYGLKAAAERRFGKAVAELTSAEYAELLARRRWPHLGEPLPRWLEPERRRLLRALSQNFSAHGP